MRPGYMHEDMEGPSFVASIGKYAIIYDPENMYQVLDEALPYDVNCIATDLSSRAEAEAFIADLLQKSVMGEG